MIYLETPLEDFFKKYPDLKETALEECEELGITLDFAKPYESQKSIGVVLDPHEKGLYSVFLLKKKM